ncbi:MAG: oxygenase MpaB family protein [Deltaproteobacteria bacterium]|nr:oxygenase MpaB family protein [Deltaproteobacteria bacterium]
MQTNDPTIRVQARAGDKVDVAIERAVAYVKQQQLPSGAWLAMEYFEPRTSSLHLVTLAFIDRVNPVEARATARFLQTLQRPDGGFPPYPFAPASELAASALVYAALSVANLDEQKAVRAKTLAYINTKGGIDAVVKKLYAAGDMTALYLAMVGLVDPFLLPDPHLAFMLAPPLLEAMEKKINAGVVEGVIFLAGVTRYLRERKEPSHPPIKWVHDVEAQACIKYIEGWLNPNGNNNGTTVQTDQAIATLFAFGRSPESVSIYSALSWFGKLKVWDDDGVLLHLRAFTNENWVTALALRALLNAGVGRDEKCVADGLDYLCWSQSKLPMPVTNLRREGGHRTGGWGFEEDNLILPDTDDTGTVLSALGLALDRTGVTPLDNARRQRVQDSVDLALQNLLDMQSDDGGWAGFVWNLGSKPAGPIFNKPIGVPANLVDTIKFFLDPPIELGEPPVEGLTGRVLQGLGANGFTAGSGEVQRAAAFLEARQVADGSFWARWLVGYVAATSCVISGMADCKWDMSSPWLKRAIDWLVSKQNADGGWGETPAAFENPNAGIISPSMPPLTGIALTALVDAGLGSSAAANRAVDYLLATQDGEGSWPTNEWLQIYEPYATYYLYEGDSWCRPLEALAKVRESRRELSPDQTAKKLAPLFAPAPVLPARPAGTWKPADLRKMRAAADRVADDVIASVFADGQQGILGQIMGALVTTDEPIPPGLPAKARAYFKDTEGLPPWADPALILQGQKLFTQHGWLMAAGLFCSSLPQAYCAANGARVLTQTQGMTRHVRRRILETAQFLFDVCVEGGFAPGGRGIRAAQKVRLMHATIRHLVLLKGEWDPPALGLPINQEDLAGTLMTFSVVLLDAVKTCGVTVPADDAAAFLHLWKVCGHFLGVDPALVPHDVADGRALMQAIRDDQWNQSVQGQLLAADLIEAVEEYLPGEVLDDLPEALIRFFTPPPGPTLLNVGGAPILELILNAGAVLDDIFNVGDGHQDPIELLVQRLARDLMIGIVNAQREGKQTGFRIPQSLVRDWSLSD